MKSIILKLALLFNGILILIATSCQKDPTQIGYDLLPGSDTLHVRTFDTTTIISYSVIHDSIRTDKRSFNLTGSIKDPVFGLTTATFYSQFRLSTENVSFGENPVLDSVVLQLRYGGYYGDTLTPQTVKVYELSQDMSLDSSYYSNQPLSTYPNLLANYTFNPRPTDSVTVDSVKTAPHIRINLSKLTNYFGQKLLSAPPDVLSSNLAFLSYMKGLAIESVPVTSGGSLLTINYKDEATGIIMYLHNSKGPATYRFLINDVCARANYFNHNGYQDASPELKNQILSHDTLAGRQKLYMQGLGGVQIKVRLPNIEALKNLGRIAINNARLIIKNAETDTTFAPIPTLYLVKKDSAGRMAFLPDFAEGAAYFGGEYNKNDRTYSFRITRHVEQILLGVSDNYDLYILASSPITTGLVPNRVILTGTNPDDPASYNDRFRLEIVYTVLQQ